jgi:hypothetical protein
MLFPILGAIAGVSALYLLLRKPSPANSGPNPNPPIPVTVKMSAVDSARAAAMARDENLVSVTDASGQEWLVAPDYIGPIGIGEAATLAKSLGMQLPTAALVDAIWRASDLKLLPMPRNNIVSEAVFSDQKQKIAEQIAGRKFKLLGGAYKDIVVGSDGFPQLYGWHVEDGKTVAGIPLLKPATPGSGKVIQPLSGHAHGLFYKDYSQGVRLVKRAPIAAV